MTLSIESKISTRKNCSVDPPATTPYLIFVCLAKSSALSIGLIDFSTVRKAAKIFQNKKQFYNFDFRSFFTQVSSVR